MEKRGYMFKVIKNKSLQSKLYKRFIAEGLKTKHIIKTNQGFKFVGNKFQGVNHG